MKERIVRRKTLIHHAFALSATLILSATSLISESGDTQLAFPGAEGFGAHSKGGRGGKVLYVTNLNDQGPGSLRWAVEQEGPRTIVFDVSGTIDLQDRITIRNPFITVAGQTAPGDGICLKGGTLGIAAHDVVVRYLRCRLGAEGRGGIANDNTTNGTVPDHFTTAQKLFLASEEDAEAFIELLQNEPDLEELEEPPEIQRLAVVTTRYANAEEIIRTGRYSAKADPEGPEPPLQMPAWKYLVEEREIDALLAYFVSLYPWEEG